MLSKLERYVDALAGFVESLDASTLSADASVRLVDLFARAQRVCDAGLTLATGRVAETRAWRASGHRTAAAWVAARTQAPLAEALSSLQTAHALSELPATREAFVLGELSGAQAAEIAAAASADPAAEGSLLDAAASSSLPELRERCRVVRAAAAGDEDTAERLRRGRYFKHWTDPDGSVRMDLRLEPSEGARVVATVVKQAEVFAAERSDQKEPMAAHKADALVALCTGTSSSAVVYVHVDADALARGRTASGETCAIPGVAPVSVGTARRLASSGSVKVVAGDGADITGVAHLGRTIPAHVRTALEARDRTCVVPGCAVRTGLEIDHIIPFAKGGPTTLANLARLCRFHHAQKTHHGWTLGGKPGAWTWTRKGRDQDGRRVERGPPARAP